MIATRRDRLVSLYAESNLVYYLKIAYRAHLFPHKLALSITSALFTDYYVPEIFGILDNPTIRE